MPITTVGALIFDPRNHVLLVRTHKWRGLWGVPGGKIEENEAMEAALVREIKEETGLDGWDVRFATVQDCIQSPEFYKPSHMILLNFTCRSPGGAVSLNEEANEFAWASLDEALGMALNTPTRRLIEQVRHG
ncbi:MAG TPA: NUDIX domain-containing protein [Oscillatoriaceae cyanobacterium]